MFPLKIASYQSHKYDQVQRKALFTRLPALSPESPTLSVYLMIPMQRAQSMDRESPVENHYKEDQTSLDLRENVLIKHFHCCTILNPQCCSNTHTHTSYRSYVEIYGDWHSLSLPLVFHAGDRAVPSVSTGKSTCTRATPPGTFCACPS